MNDDKRTASARAVAAGFILDAKKAEFTAAALMDSKVRQAEARSQCHDALDAYLDSVAAQIRGVLERNGD